MRMARWVGGLALALAPACSLVNAPDDIHAAAPPKGCAIDADCDDGDPCNGVESCEGGACKAGTGPDLDDGNPCTKDSCDPARGVIHQPFVIDDNNACTMDACNATTGAITHDPVAVDDGDLCTDDACDPMTGPSHTPIAGIDDGNGCTTDTCDPTTAEIAHTLVPGCACAHSLCAVGAAPLDQEACSWGDVDCIDKVCMILPGCCETQGGSWDMSCRTLVETDTCGFTCGCDHSYCVSGAALDATCDPCVARICEVAPACCTSTWDQACIGLVTSACNVPSGACG